ncbi:MAG: helix-turn-helix transcriptional regulator [Clostridium sp.]|nr:helix-turn-helix transcriptional regulator [Clostridium sp.]
MGRKATKASDNIFYQARVEAMEKNPEFSSREKASDLIGIDRTRLARIELSEVIPYQDEVKRIAQAYDKPELCNQYCTMLCPLGSLTTKKIKVENLDRLILNTLGALNDISELKNSLIDISQDGLIEDSEREEFRKILGVLSEISETAQSLELWARKNLERWEG